MSRQIDFRSTSTYPADEFYAAVVDPDQLRARLRQIGGRGAELLEHTADADGARYRLRHGLDAEDLPPMVRGVLPGNLAIERTERWTREERSYSGDLQVAIPGAPASAAGEMRLQEAPGGGSELQIRVDATVNVPLIGGKIESSVAEQVRQLLRAESAFTQQWLSERR